MELNEEPSGASTGPRLKAVSVNLKYFFNMLLLVLF